MLRLACLAVLFLPLILAAAAPGGRLLFADDFERAELGPAWRIPIPEFLVESGRLKGRQLRGDHGAVGGVDVDAADMVLQVDILLVDATGLNFVWDDPGYTGSHAGHICRAEIRPRHLRLGDDREGIMRKDLFPLLRDPSRQEELRRITAARRAQEPFTFEKGRWYRIRIELAGDTMAAAVDGHSLVRLQSPGLAHPTKRFFHFTVNGGTVLIDNLEIRAIGR